MSQLFFFYGTLQPEFAPAELRQLLSGFRLIGEGSVRGHLYDVGTYPGAVLEEGSLNLVFGRVYAAPADFNQLAELDQYEGFDPASPVSSDYLRVSRTVELETGGALECWAYHFNRDVSNLPRIPSGRWSNNMRA